MRNNKGLILPLIAVIIFVGAVGFFVFQKRMAGPDFPNKPSFSQTAEEKKALTDEWAVRLAPGVDPDEIATEYGAENRGHIGTLPRTYLFLRPNFDPNDAQDPLGSDPRVEFLERQYERQQQLK